MSRPILYADFGAGLRLRREARKLTAKALGAAAGITRTAIYHFEQGRLLPSEETLRKLSEALKSGSALAELHAKDAQRAREEGTRVRKALVRGSKGRAARGGEEARGCVEA